MFCGYNAEKMANDASKYRGLPQQENPFQAVGQAPKSSSTGFGNGGFASAGFSNGDTGRAGMNSSFGGFGNAGFGSSRVELARRMERLLPNRPRSFQPEVGARVKQLSVEKRLGGEELTECYLANYGGECVWF